MLYSFKGAIPTELPDRIILSDGKSRTDKTTYTASEIADAGWTIATEKPEVSYPDRVFWDNARWNIQSISLSEQKNKLLEELNELFLRKTKRPKIETAGGFTIDGGKDDIRNFEIGLELGLTTIRGGDDENYTVSAQDIEDIILLIKTKGILFYQNKWALKDAIKAASDQSELDAVNINDGWPVLITGDSL